MLKPFQIRDLRVSPSQHPERLADSHSTSSGVVQISASDYDALASNHPRARLTYVDDDDDEETITVGSALELSQRLDEPLDTMTRLESIQLSDDNAIAMHIFNIRRSNSVTELWKRFESTVPGHNPADEKDNTQTTPKSVVLEHQLEVSAPSTTSAVSEEKPRSFMEAFEADLAEMLDAAESADNEAPRTGSPPPVQPSVNTNSEQARHPVEILAAQVLNHLISGANMVQSEWRSKLPELQRQLQNAQRQFEATQESLPRNLEVSLRSLLATVEAHLRVAFNNLPDARRQMAEDAFQAGRPMVENAADGLRMMASELNEVGRTLFAAFESEFGRAGPTTSSTSSTTSQAGPLFDTATNNQAAATVPVYPQSADAHSSPTATKEESESISNPSNPSHTAQAPAHPHGSPHQSMPHYLNRWTPSPWYTPPVFPNQDASMYFSRRPGGPPVSMYAPQWSRYVRPGFNTPRNARQTSQAGSGDPRKDSTRKSLFVGNVGFQVTEKMIQDVFASKGFLVKVDLPLDTASGRHAGFGYVHFPSEHPAFAAMESLQGAVIDGHSINLELMDHTPIGSVSSAQTSIEEAQKLASSSRHGNGNTDSRSKSVTFEDIAQTVGPQIQTESSALLDSPSDDPAFSARFPSLLPDMNTPHTGPLQDQEVPSHILRTQSTSISRFPPVYQRDAQLLTGQDPGVVVQSQTNQEPRGEQSSWRQSPDQSQRSLNPDSLRDSSPVANGQQTADYNKAKSVHLGDFTCAMEAEGPRRATQHGTHGLYRNPLKHSVSMRRLGDRSRVPARTNTWARLSRRERNAPSFNQEFLGRSPVEAPMWATNAERHDAGARQSEDRRIEECVSALVDMGYGAEQDGGRSRLAVYAAAANGTLMDAIDMIEEERRVYERRASQ
ncbi:hypothetical protein N7535_000905 [Penicillium sp. DV-2018c]|nr:hypothetical protein N7461_005850 [Penicillium sp. DV-2018c]KAJ5582285.1 hypothetical protein N7535_000905 [Penicillium sp. DV-2018c]